MVHWKKDFLSLRQLPQEGMFMDDMYSNMENNRENNTENIPENRAENNGSESAATYENAETYGNSSPEVTSGVPYGTQQSGQGQTQENQFYQQPYRQPSVQEQLQYQYQRPDDELEEPMSMGEWMITLLIMMIPCANIVMAFVWAISSKEKKSKSNYFKAYLIFTAIIMVLLVIFLIVWGVAIASALDSSYYYY